MTKSFPYRIVLQSAIFTVLTLFGGLLLGVAAGFYLFDSLPGHSVISPSALHISLAALPAFAGFLGGSAAWGVWMGRMAGDTATRRMALAGMLGFAPITLVLGIGLSAVEPFVVEQIGALFPIHRIFTLMFVPSAFAIAGVSAWAVGLGLRSRALAWSLLWRVGLGAALAFLVVNLVMESAGWVVGAPDAAKRFTMLTVMFVGNLGAALAGGGALGWLAGFMTPAVRATGAEGGKFIQYVLGPMRLSMFISLSAILTVLAGLALYWRASVRFQLVWILAPSGLTLTLGAMAGIVAAILGGAVTSPTAMRLQALTRAMQSAGGPPRPEQLAELQKLQQRLGQAGQWGAILLLICVVGMAIARFV